jgi:predicted Zn-dependent protease
LRERPNKTSLWIYLAQAKASTGDHEGALVALDKCKDLSARLPGWFILKSRSEAELQKMDQAGNTLKDGLVVFPGNLDLLREKCMLMFLMGLYNEAARTAASMFTADSSDFSAFLMMGEALRKVGNFRDSILILEEGVLRFPKETQLKTQLAYVYALDGQHLAAARLFERLTRSGQDLAFETADQYRLAGRHQDALKWNGKVKNGQRRQNQRLAIAISGKLYALACSMAAQLEHCGQVGDNTSYQLAYSCFRHGDFPQSIRFLDRISDPTLASSAQGIRDAISRVM